MIGIQRRLIAIVEDILGQLRPDLAGEMKPPSAMLWFGMINWMHTWLDPDGPAKPARIAELAAEVFLRGIEEADIAGLS